jgi:hypothetical protein
VFLKSVYVQAFANAILATFSGFHKEIFNPLKIALHGGVDVPVLLASAIGGAGQAWPTCVPNCPRQILS